MVSAWEVSRSPHADVFVFALNQFLSDDCEQTRSWQRRRRQLRPNRIPSSAGHCHLCQQQVTGELGLAQMFSGMSGHNQQNLASR